MTTTNNLATAEIPKKPGIYKITNLINNKIYIGKSVNLRNRINAHKRVEKCTDENYKYNHKYTSIFHQSLRKHGLQNFKIEFIEILKEANNEDLLNLEEYYIFISKADQRGIGYNICKKGCDSTGRKLSEEHKKKIGDANRGEKSFMWGKHHSQETKDKLSAIFKGKKYTEEGKLAFFRGKRTTKYVLSDEGRRKRLEAAKNRVISEETREKIRRARAKQPPTRSTPIYQIDLKTREIIKEWPSLLEAATVLNIKKGGISKVLRDNRKKSGGFFWKYVDSSKEPKK